MSKSSWKVEINLPIDQVWKLLSDNYADIYKMHPGVNKSYQVENTPTLGVGQERVCQMYDGNSAQERIIAHEEGKLLALSIVEATFPIEKFIAEFHLSELTDNRTLVTMKVDVIGKGFFKLLSPLMALKSKQGVTKVLEGLETHGQTGQLVGKGGQLEGLAT